MPIHRFMHLLCPLLCAIGAWRGQVVWELRRRLLRRLQPPLWRWEHGSVTVNCQLPPPPPNHVPSPITQTHCFTYGVCSTPNYA